jgi:uncharacterized protein
MLYWIFPRCSHDTSILGFGAMRLPLAGDRQDAGNVEKQQVIEIIRAAVNVGVNYIDTAYQHKIAVFSKYRLFLVSIGYGTT